eukprot:CAMPEP_0204372916 /NCGR_PEP_ID=MMETSP0469-20131031/47644_1 /ASSEMBLY_ACC=CAM_ASM_000384 /TAXON_ID=2969 /ORGANISM="Oxyrrhis marina" /LENGTH=100 /DNA_ID=CAMNT_0051363281 /DNA_START=1 /DNA_END=299 /DNA_ORIENTATION=-
MRRASWARPLVAQPLSLPPLSHCLPLAQRRGRGEREGAGGTNAPPEWGPAPPTYNASLQAQPQCGASHGSDRQQAAQLRQRTGQKARVGKSCAPGAGAPG